MNTIGQAILAIGLWGLCIYSAVYKFDGISFLTGVLALFATLNLL